MSNDRASTSKSAEGGSSPNEAKLQTDDEIRGKIRADGFERYLEDEETTGMLYFLYLRKFFGHNESRRKRDIERMLSNKPNASSAPAIRGPYQRLQAVIRKESDSSVPSLQFIAFCASMAAIVKTEYVAADKSAITIFKPSPDKHAEIKMVHRGQRAANTYLQAPAVVQCYLVQNATREWNGMMNLAQFVRRNLTSEQVSDYVIEASGGNSTSIQVRSVLQPTSQLWSHASFIEQDFASIRDAMIPASWRRLVMYRPALVSFFSDWNSVS